MLQNLRSYILLEGFSKFSVNPYHDPLSWVMMMSPQKTHMDKIPVHIVKPRVHNIYKGESIQLPILP